MTCPDILRYLWSSGYPIPDRAPGPAETWSATRLTGDEARRHVLSRLPSAVFDAESGDVLWRGVRVSFYRAPRVTDDRGNPVGPVSRVVVRGHAPSEAFAAAVLVLPGWHEDASESEVTA